MLCLLTVSTNALFVRTDLVTMISNGLSSLDETYREEPSSNDTIRYIYMCSKADDMAS